MLRIFTCVVFGVVSVLIPLNGFSATFGDVVHTAVLVGQSVVVFVLAILTKHGVAFFVKGLTRFVLKLTVVHLVRLYIMVHPDISNARVEKYRDRLVARVRERVRRVHGVRRVMAIFGIVSAAMTVYTVLLVLGAVSLVYEYLLGPATGMVASAVARTVVGKVLIAWYSIIVTLLHTHVHDRYHRVRRRYLHANMRVLRKSARKYRRLHRRTDDEAE